MQSTEDKAAQVPVGNLADAPKEHRALNEERLEYAATLLLNQDRELEALQKVCSGQFETIRLYKAKWQEEKRKRLALERKLRLQTLDPQVELAITRAKGELVKCWREHQEACDSGDKARENEAWARVRIAQRRLELAGGNL